AVVVRRMANRFDGVAMTMQASGRRRAKEMRMGEWLGDVGRGVPALSLRVPVDRRLEDVAVAVDQVGAAMSGRSQGKFHFRGSFRDQPTALVAPFFRMKHAFAATLNLILKSEFLKRVVRVRLVALMPDRQRHRLDRAAHRVLMVGLSDLAMTTRTDF